MAKSLLDLAKTLENKVMAIENKASELAIETAEIVITDLLESTPVDTANALSNWHISLNTPSSQSISPYSIFNRTASSKIALQKALEVLKNKKPGELIIIQNNEDYIGDLNDGSSSQAPAGFVQRAVLRGRNFLRNYKFKV